MKNSNTYFVEENLNPLNKKAGDCVIRALSKASGKSWNTVYKELCEMGFKLKALPDGKEVWSEWLKQNIFNEGSINIQRHKETNSKILCKQTYKRYILSVAHHLVTVVNGRYYDT